MKKKKLISNGARCKRAMDLMYKYKGIDGAHHKDWLLAQIARELLQNEYDEWVKNYKKGEDGPETYEWDEGVAP
jgi:hypothetical protein